MQRLFLNQIRNPGEIPYRIFRINFLDDHNVIFNVNLINETIIRVLIFIGAETAHSTILPKQTNKLNGLKLANLINEMTREFFYYILFVITIKINPTVQNRNCSFASSEGKRKEYHSATRLKKRKEKFRNKQQSAKLAHTDVTTMSLFFSM